MNNSNNYKEKFKKLLKGNTFYFAVALSLLTAAVAGISATSTKAELKAAESTTKSYADIVIPEVTTKKQNGTNSVEISIDEFTTVKAEEPSTVAVFDNNTPKLTEEVTEKTDISYSSPLGFTTGKDYSMGIPVFSQTMNDYRTHNGVDFQGIKGENVKTPAEGIVTSVTKDAVWGNTVTIDHRNGVTSSISGLSDEALISVGAEVYSDTIIGVVGTIPIESADDNHIHLEMRVNGELVDPLEILGLAGEE